MKRLGRPTVVVLLPVVHSVAGVVGLLLVVMVLLAAAAATKHVVEETAELRAGETQQGQENE